MTKPKLSYGAASEIGLVRDVNEDSKLHAPPLFAVADGMGGHLAGDVASALAIQTLIEHQHSDDFDLAATVALANRAIYAKASSNKELSGMGTTITAVLAGEREIQIAHVGDCRAYILRGGELTKLTADHTVVERLVRQGKIQPEEADRHPQRSYLERALGIESTVDIDTQTIPVGSGDRILLCSDGLFGMIDENQIKSILVSENDPTTACRMLCDQAVQAGGRDNVTTVIIDYPNGPDAQRIKSTGSPESAGPPAVVTAGKQPGDAPAPGDTPAPPGKTQRSKKPVAYIAAAVVIILAGIFVARAVVKSSWYVGQNNGVVAIFNGVPGSIVGMELSELSSRSSLDVADLPELYRGRLEDGIRASGPDDARGIISDLKRLATPSPSPSPSPPPQVESPATPSP